MKIQLNVRLYFICETARIVLEFRIYQNGENWTRTKMVIFELKNLDLSLFTKLLPCKVFLISLNN